VKRAWGVLGGVVLLAWSAEVWPRKPPPASLPPPAASASLPGGPLPLGVVSLHTDERKLERAATTRCGAGGEAPLALAGQRAAEGRRPPALLPGDLAGDLCAEALLVQ
jgi:hypothetical protein